MNFRNLRRWAPLCVLVLLSIVSWKVADRADIDNAAVSPEHYDHELATPLLAARRLPETVRAPIIDDNLQPAIDALIAGSAGNRICLTVEVDDRVLVNLEDSTPLVPASNQKILTTFVALEVLGPDHRFVTSVRIDGVIVDGVLQGNLFLVGGGDPYLSTDDWWSQYTETNGRSHTSLNTLADAVAATGLTSLTGGLFGDEALFDSVRHGPWPQRLIDQKQSGPLSALSVNEGHLGGWPREFTSSSQRAQTDNPPLHAAQVFASLLGERGITIPTAEVGVAPASSSRIAFIESPSLLDTVTHINSYSSNYGAEVVLKHLGIAAGGAGQGTTQAGAAAVLSHLSDQGFRTAGVVVMDGSGLADGVDLDGDGVPEQDLLTCALLADVLETADPDSDFAASLSIGGERGSLLTRFEESPAAGQVAAKTGTLNDVTALSGYVESLTESETSLIFTYVVNGELAGADVDLKAIQVPFIEQLAAYPVGPTIEDLNPLEPLPVPAATNSEEDQSE